MPNLRRTVIFSSLLLLCLTTAACGATHALSAAVPARCPWLNTNLPIAVRVQKLISAMTLQQKIAEMEVQSETYTGTYAGYEGFVPAQPSLCIPALTEQDDSLGVATGARDVTQLPSATALSSAWDPSLAYQYGVVNGKEHRDKGIDMVLGPGVNIQRDPEWGRNFEMLSEDPYLTAQLAVPEVEGIQSQHVLVDVKHYDAYNQETYRNTPADDVIVSQRALHEIYMPAFYAAVTLGHAASVMCSYATVNGTYSCQNAYLLTDVLFDSWGFAGFVRSDGGANHSTVASVNAGLMQEKGSTYFSSLAQAVEDHQVSMSTINNAVRRIFTEMMDYNLFNDPPTGNLQSPATNPTDAAFAQTVAEDGTVLLKNSGPILPLTATVHSIAIIGPDGSTSPLTSGGGSSHVTPPYVISPLQGIQSAAPSGMQVTSYSGTDPTQAAAAAAAAQVAIVFASNYEEEGQDLTSLDLSGDQNQIIAAVAAANPNTIVVLNTGGPVVMPWVNAVKAVLEAWYPGQQDGDAIAAILFGQVDPEGHLPETFPTSLSETPTSSPSQFPGVDGEVHYSEGIFVGYRWYDANNVTPLFPFGFGLSYTTFSFRDLHLASSTMGLASPEDGRDTITVTATITNTGSVSGSDVAQLYVGDPASTGEPPRQLKGFQRVTLDPGQSKEVTFTVNAQDLAYWDTSDNSWAVADGTYKIYVGDSSALANLPLQGQFHVQQTTDPQGVTVTASAMGNAGHTLAVTAAFHNGSNVKDTKVDLSLQITTGGNPAPEASAAALLKAHAQGTTSFRSVSPGQTVQGRWTISVPASAPDGTYQFNVTAAYTTPAGRATRSNYADSALTYTSLAAAFNNVGITTASDVSAGNYDGDGNSFSAEALAAYGLVPGATLSINGVTIHWPSVAPGQPDNVELDGQSIQISGSGSDLVFVGTGSFGNQVGTGTITYQNGTTQTFQLSLGDWISRSAPNDQLLGNPSPEHRSDGNPPTSVNLFMTEIPLTSDLSVKMVTLPADSEMHVFYMGIS